MRVLVMGIFALALATTAAGAGLSTWSGSIGLVGAPSSASRPSAKLSVGASSVRADFAGLTGAAHDAPTARTTCWIGFGFAEKSGAWRYYREIGRPHLTAAGYVENSPCLGATGITLRVRVVSSRALSAQFNTDPSIAADEFRAAYAGKLHR